MNYKDNCAEINDTIQFNVVRIQFACYSVLFMLVYQTNGQQYVQEETVDSCHEQSHCLVEQLFTTVMYMYATRCNAKCDN